MKFKNRSKTIFLDPNSLETYKQNKEEMLNIILSPSLYWVKKISLPVKYIRDAKKLLPSIFEETLPAGNYSYYLYKKDGEFFIFAYEDKIILETITKAGILASNIDNIYFAQSELSGISDAVNVSDTQSIYVKDDIVVLVPCYWIKKSRALDLSQVTLSKHKITLHQYAHIVDNSSLYKVGAMLIVLFLLIFSEYFITREKISQVVELKNEVFQKYSLKSTMMQNQSILKKYEEIHKKQTKLRENISYFLSIRLKSTEKLSSLSFKNKILRVKFTNLTTSTLKEIEKMLKIKKVNFKFDKQATLLIVDVVL